MKARRGRGRVAVTLGVAVALEKWQDLDYNRAEKELKAMTVTKQLTRSNIKKKKVAIFFVVGGTYVE